MTYEVHHHEGVFDERAALAASRARALRLRHWSNAPGDTHAAHSHSYHKLLCCLRGSIVFRMADGAEVNLGPGDRLEIAPGTAHSAVVGPRGVACVEAVRS